jgi:hypothetical protein
MKLTLIAAIAATLGCAPASAPTATRPSATSTLFDVHSGAWINLHHVLWGQALQRTGDAGARSALDDDAGLDEASARTWRAAVDFYAASYAGRDFIFDDTMAELNHRLSAIEDRADIRASQLPPDLVEILAQTMPIYRAHRWPADALAALSPDAADAAAAWARYLAEWTAWNHVRALAGAASAGLLVAAQLVCR